MKYRLGESVSPEIDAVLSSFDPLTRQLLFNRGIKTKEEAEKFFSPNYNEHRHDAWALPDMEKAIDRIEKALSDSETIAIFGDYDADGIPATTLLYDVFTALGHEKLTVYVPDRNREGFGLNRNAIEKLKEKGVSLIITVDCGSTNVAEVEYANEIGIDVIITDHHEVPENFPPAVAIVNPKHPHSTYPFLGLSGTGVAFRLAESLLERLRSRGVDTPPEGWEKWLLDLVAIATVADMVPLTDENRVLSHFGLKVLNLGRRPGVQALLAQSNRRSELSAEDISFYIAPRLNAASRLGDPMIGFNLLSTKNDKEAANLASELEQLNRERRGQVAAMVKAAAAQIGGNPADVIVVGHPDWLPGLLGLVASSINEKFGRPTFVWGRAAAEEIKGSCRSSTLSVHSIMEKAQHVFSGWGGHTHAGGFSLSSTRLHELESALLAAISAGIEIEEEEKIIDAALTPADVTDEFLEVVQAFAPWGIGNDQPVFLLKQVSLRATETFGKNKEHLKLRLDNGLEAIAFFKSLSSFGVEDGSTYSLIDLVAHIEYDDYRHQPRLRIVDILART